MELNKNQKLASELIDKSCCVLAGPGTGKTLTITAKIVNLLHQNIPSTEVVALTFTQKAAAEMRQRIFNVLKNKETLPFIGTFHLLCIKLLRDFLSEKNFQICTRQKQIEILKSLGDGNPDKTAEKISRFKSTSAPLEDDSYRIYLKYEEAKRKLNLFDFDDLLLETLKLQTEGVIPPLFSYIIVDEFQDTNRIQYEIIKKLLKKDGQLCVFGDPDQAIYSFRGSEVELFLNLPKDFKDLVLINLGLNYRCQANIVFASNAFITLNTKRFSKKIEPIRDKTHPIYVIEASDEYEEAKIVVREIKKRVGIIDFTELYQNKEESNYSFSSFAILARTNSQLELFKEFLTEAGIPFKTLPKEEGRIRSLVDSLSRVVYEDSIKPHLFKEISLLALLRNYGFFESLNDKEAYIVENIVKTYEKGVLVERIKGVIDELITLTSYDLFPENLNAVSLLTLHGTKGLEFPVVFITGCEEGLIPYSLAKDVDIEEERRLFYVGMTRAMDELILTYSKSRLLHGKRLSLPSSSFITQIPKEYLYFKKSSQQKCKPKQRQLF
ncbi:MAG: ATP-dependent helicase [Thermodesulfovibrio sp.]|nr:ATP-dependent helicase [Thermodesulfovibrio sp.]